jgi:hypothetical protein
MIKSIAFWTAAVVSVFSPLRAIAEPDVSLKDNRFIIDGQTIPSGCFAQLMTQLNGDNIVASIFLTRPSLRGCIDANDPYPGGNEDAVTIEAKELTTNLFGLKICEQVDGSIGTSCDRILVKFTSQDYRLDGRVKTAAVVTKVGDWE